MTDVHIDKLVAGCRVFDSHLLADLLDAHRKIILGHYGIDDQRPVRPGPGPVVPASGAKGTGGTVVSDEPIRHIKVSVRAYDGAWDTVAEHGGIWSREGSIDDELTCIEEREILDVIAGLVVSLRQKEQEGGEDVHSDVHDLRDDGSAGARSDGGDNEDSGARMRSGEDGCTAPR